MLRVLTFGIFFLGTYVVLGQTNLFRYVPCREPILYSIGTFDQRFILSKAEFIKALSDAEAVWEKSLGKELFAYSSEKGGLAVNLVYDYRQETTSTLEDIEHKVEQSEASYEVLQAKYNKLKSEYEMAKRAYDAKVSVFNTASSVYEQHVADWNSSPRTSKSQFAKLEMEKNALQAQLNSLKADESKLNQQVRDINSLVESLNSLATTLNLNVKAYNTIGAKRGESFTGGIYYNADGKEGIDIYEFSSREKLVRILAHELGHALGLDHIDDPRSIMYHLNEGSGRVAAESDKIALKVLCEVE